MVQSGEEDDPQLLELEQRLRRQQRESEEDSRWLQEEETNLVLNITYFDMGQVQSGPSLPTTLLSRLRFYELN